MRSFKAPDRYEKQPNEVTLFLAGAIDNGKAVDWQDYTTEQLSDLDDLIILNPRRADWDSTWECSINNPQFVEQVNWELDGLNSCDLTLMYFPANSIAPISLLELGIITTQHLNTVIVVCEDGYHRKGNVDIVCDRYGVIQLDSLDQAINYIKTLDLTEFRSYNGVFLENDNE